MSNWLDRLQALDRERLLGMRRGVEKESLRALPDGSLALTPHPAGLGSALTHPHITTDFSESQLELITGVHASAQDCLAELTEIHRAVDALLGEETMWASSMPCVLPTDETIPIGRYGSSNIGRAKSVYRMGLGHRYGRRMQTISGIHYNWSLPGLSSSDYFALIRNFRRHSFLLLLLFGASPALCSSFVAGRNHGLEPLSDVKGQGHCHTLHLPHATSLRMGRLGYQSDAQSSLAVSYNCLDGYASSLQDALLRPYPAYEAIGVMNPGGEYNQLSTSLLQIENEFYGTIRPKRVIKTGERPLHALRERGVEYIEVRCMDLDPFEPVGINTDTMRMLDLFLLHCWLTDSPPDTPEEIAALGRNQHLTASRGREPGLRLERGQDTVLLMDWARELLEQLRPIAGHMDETLPALSGEPTWQQLVEEALSQLAAPEQLPSARVLQAIREQHQASHIVFVRQQSMAARELFRSTPLSTAQQSRFDAMAQESLAAQAHIEHVNTEDFETFRQRYLAPDQLMFSPATATPDAGATH